MNYKTAVLVSDGAGEKLAANITKMNRATKRDIILSTTLFSNPLSEMDGTVIMRDAANRFFERGRA